MNKFIKFTLLFLTAFSVSLSSCKKEDQAFDNKEANLKESASVSIIGEEHNIALDYYYNNLSGTHATTTTQDKIINATNIIIDCMVDRNYIEELDKHQFTSIAINSNYFGFVNTGTSMFQLFETKINEVISSNELKMKFYTVIDIIENNPNDVSQLFGYVNTEIQGVDWGTDQEKVNVFIDVLYNSNTYWNDYYDGFKNTNSVLWENSSSVIAGDALGAIHGLIWGPIGSIIEGAVVSIIINEGWYTTE